MKRETKGTIAYIGALIALATTMIFHEQLGQWGLFITYTIGVAIMGIYNYKEHNGFFGGNCEEAIDKALDKYEAMVDEDLIHYRKKILKLKKENKELQEKVKELEGLTGLDPDFNG